MLLVVDASVAIQVSIAGVGLGRLESHELIAPPLLASEVTSTLSEMAYRGEIPPEQARRAMMAAHQLGIREERTESLHRDAWDLARALGWAKTYDAEYVVLARRLGVPLVTIDARLRRGVGHLVEMPLVSDL